MGGGPDLSSGARQREGISRQVLVGVLIIVVSAALLSAASYAIRIVRDRGPEPIPHDEALDKHAGIPLRKELVPAVGQPSGRLGYGSATGTLTGWDYNDPPAHVPASFNRWTGVPAIGDERPFASAVVTSSGTSYPTNAYAGEHVVDLEEGDTAWLRVYVSNAAAVPADDGKTCADDDRYTSIRGAALRLAVWNGPETNRYVVRAWLTSDNAEPAWVTDAVVIYSRRPIAVEPGRSLVYSAVVSEQGEQIPGSLTETAAVLAGDPVQEPVTIGAEGMIGPCWQNRRVVMVAFEQSEG